MKTSVPGSVCVLYKAGLTITHVLPAWKDSGKGAGAGRGGAEGGVNTNIRGKPAGERSSSSLYILEFREKLFASVSSEFVNVFLKNTKVHVC